MTQRESGERPLTEACPFCDELVDAGDAGTTNVRVRPVHGHATVGFTAHAACLDSAFVEIGRRRGVESIWAHWFEPAAS